eukprot:GHVN01005426.1.p1 GENE.GHVN01005426.1~~GHVN01005426.1.p1  ORF type:complete len:129 (-),score=8.04 GHVN01005426.1:350-736(-)
MLFKSRLNNPGGLLILWLACFATCYSLLGWPHCLQITCHLRGYLSMKGFSSEDDLPAIENELFQDSPEERCTGGDCALGLPHVKPTIKSLSLRLAIPRLVGNNMPPLQGATQIRRNIEMPKTSLRISI